ncbi:MAG: hypothetical protein KJZ84_23755 [Bryobacteraceae bacterium]|nr:hypothetical protein [Bryobacteraceae bacterium]
MKFLLIPVLILSLFGLNACRREPEFARVDAALAPLIPPDAEAIACIRLDRIKKTWFQEKYIAAGRVPQLERFAEMTGLDVYKDVWELLLVMQADGAPPVVLIRGKFGGSFGLEPQFEKPGLQRMSYKGYYIIYGDGPGVMFLNTGAAAAGRIEDLKRIVDRRDEPGWKQNQTLLDLAETLPGVTPIWMVTAKGGKLVPQLPSKGLLGGAANLAKSLGPLTMHTSLDDGLAITVRGGYPDAATARQAAQAVRALVGVARSRSGERESPLQRLANGIRVNERETEVEIQAQVPEDLVETLLTLLD